MDKNQEKLRIEIGEEIDELKNLEPGSQEYTAAVAGLEKLYKLDIESTRLKIEAENAEREEQFKAKQLKSDNFSRNFKTGAEIFGVIATTVSAAWFAIKGFKFEETGTIRSQIFKNGLSFFKIKK